VTPLLGRAPPQVRAASRLGKRWRPAQTRDKFIHRRRVQRQRAETFTNDDIANHVLTPLLATLADYSRSYSRSHPPTSRTSQQHRDHDELRHRGGWTARGGIQEDQLSLLSRVV